MKTDLNDNLNSLGNALGLFEEFSSGASDPGGIYMSTLRSMISDFCGRILLATRLENLDALPESIFGYGGASERFTIEAICAIMKDLGKDLGEIAENAGETARRKKLELIIDQFDRLISALLQIED